MASETKMDVHTPNDTYDRYIIVRTTRLWVYIVEWIEYTVKSE
jgi:hypothetical protein